MVYAQKVIHWLLGCRVFMCNLKTSVTIEWPASVTHRLSTCQPSTYSRRSSASSSAVWSRDLTYWFSRKQTQWLSWQSFIYLFVSTTSQLVWGRVCVCVWDGTPRGAILVLTQQSCVPSCLCFLLTRHGRKNRSTCLRSILGTRKKGESLSAFSIADGKRRTLPGFPSQFLPVLRARRVQRQQVGLWLAYARRQGRVSLAALLGRRWGWFARMVSFICKAAFLMHTRWSDAAFPSNHLDDTGFRWAQHFPIWPGAVGSFRGCSLWVGHQSDAPPWPAAAVNAGLEKQHFKSNQAKKETSWGDKKQTLFLKTHHIWIRFFSEKAGMAGCLGHRGSPPPTNQTDGFDASAPTPARSRRCRDGDRTSRLSSSAESNKLLKSPQTGTRCDGICAAAHGYVHIPFSLFT